MKKRKYYLYCGYSLKGLEDFIRNRNLKPETVKISAELRYSDDPGYYGITPTPSAVLEISGEEE